MRIFNRIIQAVKSPVPTVDRVLELVSLFMLIVLLVLTAVLYQQAPEQIPNRFGWDGDSVSWAGKEMYWYMSIFFVIMMLVASASAYDLRMVNLPVRLKEPVKELQMAQVSRMSRCLTICFGLMWLSYLLSASSLFLNIVQLSAIYSKLTLFLLLAVVVYYTWKIWWIGRKY